METIKCQKSLKRVHQKHPKVSSRLSSVCDMSWGNKIFKFSQRILQIWIYQHDGVERFCLVHSPPHITASMQVVSWRLAFNENVVQQSFSKILPKLLWSSTWIWLLYGFISEPWINDPRNLEFFFWQKSCAIVSLTSSQLRMRSKQVLHAGLQQNFVVISKPKEIFQKRKVTEKLCIRLF